MRSGWAATTLLMGMTFAAEPAWSLALVRTSADAGGTFSSFVDSNQYPNLTNEPHLSALSHASELNAYSDIAAGSMSSCFSPSPTCALAGTDRLVNSFASANGNNGRLRAGADAHMSGPIGGGNVSATASATLIDTITLTSPIIKISLDVTSLSTLHAGADASFTFLFRFADPTPNNIEDQGPTPIFAIEGFSDDTDEGYVIHLLDSGIPIESGSSIPGLINFEADLSDPAFASLFASPFPSVPPAFDLNGPNLFEFALIARARCETDPCSASSRLDETLYIELEGSSANGYNYLGREAVEPPPTGIPTPASAALLLGGLLGLAAARRR